MSRVIGEKEKLLHIAFDRLSEKYPSGLYEWLYIHDPETSREMSGLEDRVNANFRRDGSVAELKSILRAYWIAHIKAIKTFNENGKLEDPLDKVRQERIQELETMHL